MDERTFALDLLWDDCLQIARVNVLTGRCTFIKSMPENALSSAPDLNLRDYLLRTVADGRIHPADENLYLDLADKDTFARLISQADRKVSIHFRAHMGASFQWIMLELLLPADFSPFRPDVLLCWRRTDAAFCAIQEALSTLSYSFHKILRVNLTTDSYELVKVNPDELDLAHGASLTLSGWFSGFLKSGGVLEEDQERFRRFTQLDELRRTFHRSRAPLSCRYRRHHGNGYRWVSMELVPDVHYSDEQQLVMLYIRDIHDSSGTL